MSLDMFLDSPLECHIDSNLKQEDIDSPQWCVFPDCYDCNPNGRIINLNKSEEKTS